MKDKKTVISTMLIVAGVLCLGTVRLYVGRLGELHRIYSNSLLAKPPAHGACFTFQADYFGSQGTNSLPALKEALRKRFWHLGTRIYWEQLSESRFRIYAPIEKPHYEQIARDFLFRKGQVEFRLVHPKSRELLLQGGTVEGYETLHSASEPSDDKSQERLFLIAKTAEGGSQGYPILNATPSSDNSGETIKVDFTPEGGAAFSLLTREKLGQQLAAVMDDEVLAAPWIREQIKGNHVNLTGKFTRKKVVFLSVVMKCPLPVPVNLLETRIF